MGTINLGNIKDNTYIEPEEIDEMFAGSTPETSKVLKTSGLKHLIDKIKSMFSEKPAVVYNTNTEIPVGEIVSVPITENIEQFSGIEVWGYHSTNGIRNSVKLPIGRCNAAFFGITTSGEVIPGFLNVSCSPGFIVVANTTLSTASIFLTKLVLYKN